MNRSLLPILFLSHSLTLYAQVDFSSSQVCKGNLTVLTGTSVLNDTLIQSWLWDLDNDGGFDDAAGKMLNYIFPNEGNSTVRLKIILKSSAEDSASKAITVFPLPNVIYTAGNICEGNQVMFNANAAISSGMVVQYKWDFNNDNLPDYLSLDSSFGFFLGQAGDYWVNVQAVSEQGCVSSAYGKGIKIFNQPNADFYTQGYWRAEDTIQFVNSTLLSNENLMACLWNFGDNNTASGTSSVWHSYTSEGSYAVTLIAISENNCADTITKTLNIDTSVKVDIKDTVIISDTLTVTDTVPPTKQNLKNLLTPNGDGINDLFMIEEVTKGQICEIRIFNQWNEQVYNSSAYNNDWDGKDLPTGAYFFIMDCSGQKQTGSISILK